MSTSRTSTRLSRRRSGRVVAALLGATVFLTACGAGGQSESEGGSGEGAAAEGDTTGISGDTIKIGTHMPLTGVAAPGYSEIPTGAKAYLDHVNANGGVCEGKTFEYVVRDDAYNPTNTSQVTNQLVLQDEIFAMLGGLGTPTHSAVIDFLNEEEVPDLFVSSGALAWDDPENNPFTFGWQPNYEVEGKIIGRYIAENFPDAKVGLFLQGDDFGRDGAAGARQFLEDQIVSEVKYTPGNIDVGPQITQLKADGADFVLGFNVPSYTALSQLTALRLQYQPQWFYSNVGSDLTLVGSLLNRFSEGAVKDASPLNGIFTTKYLPTVEDADNPWTQTFQKIWEEQGTEGELSNFRIYGMSQAYTLVAAMQRSCDNLSREGVVQAIEESGSEITGPWLAPFDYSADSHRGISGVQVVQVKGQTIENLTEIQTTDSGDAEIEEYTEEPSTPTEDGLPEA